MKIQKIILALLLFAWVPAHAEELFEISLGFNYTHTNYSKTDYNWTRRWTASFGIHMTPLTELQADFTHSTDRTYINGYQDTTLTDRVYGVSVVQMLLPRGSPMMPYVRGGIGQLNRDASGSYANGTYPAQQVDQVTGILGAGLKLYLSSSFAIKADATTYLSGGRIGTWRDNIAGTVGVSLSF